MDDSMHHAAAYDALMAARLATSLAYVLARLFPASGGQTAATHIRQMVGKIRWMRHVRAEWVADQARPGQLDVVEWAKWKAKY
jgi:hypothetical protein